MDCDDGNLSVLSPEHEGCVNANLTGGKGSSLAILNTIEGVDVPAFFCVSTIGFRQVIDASPLVQSLISKLQNLSNNLNTGSDGKKKPVLKSQSSAERFSDLNAVFAVALSLRKAIELLPFPEDIRMKVENAYKGLNVGLKNLPVAVRSSATTEDTKDASFAGQHDTFLNQRGIKDVIQSIRKCWASCFTDRAVEYRNRNKIAHRDAVMSVVVQEMIFPSVAGTAFSEELSTGFPAIHITATYGIGEAVVSGEVTADEFLVERNVDKSKARVIKRVMGSKLTEFRPKRMILGSKTKNCNTSSETFKIGDISGIEQVDVDKERRNKFCMESPMVQHIASNVTSISLAYKTLFDYENVDTEFAIDEKGKLLMLQCRPVVMVERNEIKTVDLKQLQHDSAIVSAMYSLLGAVHGRAKVIEDFADLIAGEVVIEPEDIIFTAKTANYWNQYLTNLKGIVTQEGSATAHPMLIGRERHLPVICGIPGLVRRMKKYDGKIITIDGLTKKVYLGKQKLRTAEAKELQLMFESQSVAKIQPFENAMDFLRTWKRTVNIDDKDWVFNPNWKMSLAWREMTMAGYPMRFPIVNNCRKDSKRLSKDPLNNETRSIDEKVADIVLAEEETLKIFSGFTIQDAEKLHHTFIDIAHNYLSAADTFLMQRSLVAFDHFAETYASLMAVMYLHYYWQLYLKIQSSTAANRLRMSRMHFEQLLVLLQEEIPEEDVTFRNLIKDAAALIVHSDISSMTGKQIDSKNLLDQDMQKWFREVPALREKVQYMATNFRVKEATDIAENVAATELLVLTKVLEAVEQGATYPIPQHKRNVHIDFFPDNQEDESLLRWTRLSVRSRCQKSDFHHYRLRGQWKVREALAQICKTREGQHTLTLKDFINRPLSMLRSDIEKGEGEAISKLQNTCFPTRTSPAVENLVLQLHNRIQSANDGSGRQLCAEDIDLIEPLISSLSKNVSSWFCDAQSGKPLNSWPFKVGKIGDVERCDLIITDSFSVRLHKIPAGFHDVTPHTHSWNFFSYILRGGYRHKIYRIRQNDEGKGRKPVELGGGITWDCWRRDRYESFGKTPNEKMVRLKLSHVYNYRPGNAYFLDSDMVHALDNVQEETVTFIIRSRLGNIGSSSTYGVSGFRPIWDYKKTKYKNESMEMAEAMKRWVDSTTLQLKHLCTDDLLKIIQKLEQSNDRLTKEKIIQLQKNG